MIQDREKLIKVLLDNIDFWIKSIQRKDQWNDTYFLLLYDDMLALRRVLEGEK